MPVFGKSLFETVLEVLDQQVDEVEEDIPHAPIRGFNGSFIGRDWVVGSGGESDPSDLFDGFAPDPVISVPDVSEPLVPDWIDRLSETEVAEDLALADCRTQHDLRERRRLFAFVNHPDRVAADYQDQATRRMTIANQLIDAALAKLR